MRQFWKWKQQKSCWQVSVRLSHAQKRSLRYSKIFRERVPRWSTISSHSTHRWRALNDIATVVTITSNQSEPFASLLVFAELPLEVFRRWFLWVVGLTFDSMKGIGCKIKKSFFSMILLQNKSWELCIKVWYFKSSDCISPSFNQLRCYAYFKIKCHMFVTSNIRGRRTWTSNNPSLSPSEILQISVRSESEWKMYNTSWRWAELVILEFEKICCFFACTLGKKCFQSGLIVDDHHRIEICTLHQFCYRR